MVHFYNSAFAAAAVTSVVLSSLAPGVQAAPAMPPLPMRQEARRSMLKSGYVSFHHFFRRSDLIFRFRSFLAATSILRRGISRSKGASILITLYTTTGITGVP